MCGLAGFLDRSHSLRGEELCAVVTRMADTLHHRGPNDGGAWTDPAAGLALGFRRLAIVDLSPEGHQPMHSAGGRYVITFNGEIYNFAALRKELENGATEPPKFRGHSDTEVLLAAVEAWGVEEAVRRFAGMFAFALWDRRDQVLYLGRDRLGEKPLYYGWARATFLFASELKALRRHPHFEGRVRRDALVPYLRQGYIPAPHSIYENVWKLPPGTILTLRASQGPASAARPAPYWSAREAAEEGVRQRFRGSESEAIDQLDEVLRRTVREQMVADVPLGAFLSGGVDSSTVVALMQAQSPRPVRTFTIGFHEGGFNEAQYAAAVARHLGTEHTELYVTPADALAVIPRLPALYDEPFADSSQVPTFLVAEMARRHVTVSLSGDGGDEVFAGYSWYGRGELLWRNTRWLPRLLRRLVAGAGRLLLPRRLRRPHKLAELLAHADRPEDLHQWLISAHWDLARVLPGAVEPSSSLTDPDARPSLESVTEALQCFDMLTYLPDDILVKVDRASMGVSLESRAPFLDHRVVEFAWRLPPALKLRQGQGKWALRQVLYRYVPPALIERPKQGFSVPVGPWLRGPLRDWAEDLLSEERLVAQGFFAAAPVRQLWQQHLAGKHDCERRLWHVLMFQAWLAGQGK